MVTLSHCKIVSADELQNHRVVEVVEGTSGDQLVPPLLQQGHPELCPALCPGGFGRFPRSLTPQPAWAACPVAWSL